MYLVITSTQKLFTGSSFLKINSCRVLKTELLGIIAGGLFTHWTRILSSNQKVKSQSTA